MTVTDERPRPLVYLDHNMLDLLIKQESNDLVNLIQKLGDVIYSDENLAEIQRCGPYANQFTELLSKLNAKYIQQKFAENGLLAVENAKLIDCDVAIKFSEYVILRKDVDVLERNVSNFLFKMFGGLKDQTLADLATSQLDEAERSIREISSIPNSDQNIDEAVLEQALEDLHLVNQQTKATFEDNGDQLQVSALREAIGMGPVELNNIVGPNVIGQIFEKLISKAGAAGEEIDLDEILAIDKDPVNPERELLTQEKVRNLYMNLNMIGFHPDSKMHKERRFTAAFSDMEHASVAPFADVLISRDYAFVRKCAAVYEYVKHRRTLIVYINPTGTSLNVEAYSSDNSYVGKKLQ